MLNDKFLLHKFYFDKKRSACLFRPNYRGYLFFKYPIFVCNFV